MRDPPNVPTPEFPPAAGWLPAVRLAVAEDLDGRGVEGDVTGRLLLPENLAGTATLVQKAPGVTCGLPLVEPVCRLFDERLRVGIAEPSGEGEFLAAASLHPVPLLTISGPVRSLLAAERTLLNLLSHLSGVATLTRKFVQRCAGTRATVYDTRKTLPGLRLLQKYAVRCGGGHSHRLGLFDMVLVKDNHLALAGVAGGDALTRAVTQLVADNAADAPGRPVEVEVDTYPQFLRVLAVQGVDVILLDNMDCPTMRRCVDERDAATGGRPLLEASGGVSLQTVRDIAATGVDRISVGAITHSAKSLDLSLDVGVSV